MKNKIITNREKVNNKNKKILEFTESHRIILTAKKKDLNLLSDIQKHMRPTPEAVKIYSWDITLIYNTDKTLQNFTQRVQPYPTTTLSLSSSASSSYNKHNKQIVNDAKHHNHVAEQRAAVTVKHFRDSGSEYKRDHILAEIDALKAQGWKVSRKNINWSWSKVFQNVTGGKLYCSRNYFSMHVNKISDIETVLTYLFDNEWMQYDKKTDKNIMDKFHLSEIELMILHKSKTIFDIMRYELDPGSKFSQYIRFFLHGNVNYKVKVRSYNLTAKESGRNCYCSGDIFKIEIVLMRAYIKRRLAASRVNEKSPLSKQVQTLLVAVNDTTTVNSIGWKLSRKLRSAVILSEYRKKYQERAKKLSNIIIRKI